MNPARSMKRYVRRVTRAFGYELAPFQSGVRAVQSTLLETTDLVVDVGAHVGQFASSVRALCYRGPNI
jgi:hypothetical protein